MQGDGASAGAGAGAGAVASCQLRNTVKVEDVARGYSWREENDIFLRFIRCNSGHGRSKGS